MTDDVRSLAHIFLLVFTKFATLVIFIMYSGLLLRWRCLITLLNHIFDDRHCRERIWPARIEREMRDNFARLFRCEAVVHSFVQVESNLRYLTSCD